MAAKKKKKIVRRIRRDLSCPFCTSKMEPDYKKHEDLRKFVSDRAKIQGSMRTGVCSKHQRKLSREIKRARHLGLLPFAPKI